jgi:soluble P-type ATPase
MTMKPGIALHIPGFGERQIHILATDYTGTLACGGKLVPGVKERLLKLGARLDLHILTADSFGTADAELARIVIPYHLREDRHDIEKEHYVSQFDLEHVAALGNGNNDRLMLRAVKNGGGIAISIDNGEGCALDALLNSHLHIFSAVNGLDLLLDVTRCKATLRF